MGRYICHGLCRRIDTSAALATALHVRKVRSFAVCCDRLIWRLWMLSRLECRLRVRCARVAAAVQCGNRGSDVAAICARDNQRFCLESALDDYSFSVCFSWFHKTGARAGHISPAGSRGQVRGASFPQLKNVTFGTGTSSLQKRPSSGSLVHAASQTLQTF